MTSSVVEISKEEDKICTENSKVARRSLSIRYGHILGNFEEKTPLLQFLKHGDGKFQAVSVRVLSGEWFYCNDNKHRFVFPENRKLTLSLGEEIFLNKTFSIKMTRFNWHDFRIIVSTIGMPILFIQKGKYLLRTGDARIEGEHPYKLYDTSDSTSQRW